jgi:hypothetical protein
MPQRAAVQRSSAFGSGAILKKKHKVPPAYSRAEDDARSLNGRRDDELIPNCTTTRLPGHRLCMILINE